jgi:hypothetical protein
MASKVPDFDIVLTPLRTRRGEICARGKSVEIARGKLSDDYMALAINELLRQRRAWLFDRETKIRTIEYNITVKKKTRS